MVHEQTFTEGTTMQYRRVGFFALVAIALVGCGSAAALGAQPAAVDSTSSPAPACPNASAPASTPQTMFCETPDEVSLGETSIHLSSIPDQALILVNQTLTTLPSASATPPVTQAQAESTALANASMIPGARVNNAQLAALHSATGLPAAGTAVWVIDVTPPGGFAGIGNGGIGSTPTTQSHDQYVWALVDASTGQSIGTFWS